MKKKTVKTLATVLIITTMTGMTVFADDINSLTQKKNEAQSDLNSLQNELSYIMVEMNGLEDKMQDVSGAIDQVTVELEQAQATQEEQYKDMKLRIRYMYEDQGTSLTEAFLTADDMGDVLNKAEYMQKVYTYDREKLSQMSETAKTISDKKAELTKEQNDLAALQNDLTDKQKTLNDTIAEKQSSVNDFTNLLDAAVASAAKKAAEDEAARKEKESHKTVDAVSNKVKQSADSSSKVEKTEASVPSVDGYSAQGIVNYAYQFIGVPYVIGGSTPKGFDCSGFTAYVFAKFGISLPHSSYAQAYGGTRVANLSQAQPGDIIAYPGHVAIYIGGGQIIHAPGTGDVVKVASANIMQIISIRRYAK